MSSRPRASSGARGPGEVTTLQVQSPSSPQTDVAMWLWHTLTFLHCNYYTVEVSEALVSSVSLSPVAGSSETRTSSRSLAIDPMSQELITSREIFFTNKNQVTSSCGWWHPASHFSSTLDGPINYRLTWWHQSMTLVSRHVITRRAHSSRSQWVRQGGWRCGCGGWRGDVVSGWTVRWQHADTETARAQRLRHQLRPPVMDTQTHTLPNKLNIKQETQEYLNYIRETKWRKKSQIIIFRPQFHFVWIPFCIVKEWTHWNFHLLPFFRH